jgi:stage II sporulation protein Q
MNDQNKQFQNQETPKSTEGAAAAKSFSWKRFLAKKWVFPATYMAAAAIILTLMWVYQDGGSETLTEGEGQKEFYEQYIPSATEQLPDALAVTAPTETMSWPVEDRSAVEVVMGFFDSEASNEERQAAMIEYNDTFMPSVGISLSRQDFETFNVMAALSGTVTRVEKHPLMGNLVEITHNDGLKTIYQSLADVTVTNGAEVKQGDMIAKAGRNELQKALGVHMHFEVHENGQPVNPKSFLAAAAETQTAN